MFVAFVNDPLMIILYLSKEYICVAFVLRGIRAVWVLLVDSRGFLSLRGGTAVVTVSEWWKLN